MGREDKGARRREGKRGGRRIRRGEREEKMSEWGKIGERGVQVRRGEERWMEERGKERDSRGGGMREMKSGFKERNVGGGEIEGKERRKERGVEESL